MKISSTQVTALQPHYSTEFHGTASTALHPYNTTAMYLLDITPLFTVLHLLDFVNTYCNLIYIVNTEIFFVEYGHCEVNKGPAVLRGSTARMLISVLMCDQRTACNPHWHIWQR